MTDTVPTQSETFQEVLGRFSRRKLLGGGAALAAAAVARPLLGASPAGAKEASFRASALSFDEVPPGTGDQWILPKGYVGNVLIAWGDPIHAGVPVKDPRQLTAAEQEKCFGFNCDYTDYVHLSFTDPNTGLLWVNHEYTEGYNMFPGYPRTGAAPTKEQVDVELAAHGGTILEIQKLGGHAGWRKVLTSRYNRRITATTPMTITGPAAGHDLVKTNADPTGRTVLGMLNNCGGGKTPWGTILTAEENFNQYFANASTVPDGRQKTSNTRYGIPNGASERKWETFYDRFDLAKEPNEVHRFGYIVEIDPLNPGTTPKKRTSIGRLKHEAAATTLSAGGRPVVYTGDDQIFEYAYKFVAKDTFNPRDRRPNMDLLDEGTLHVAKFNDDGTGQWIPLTPADPRIAAVYPTQAEICVFTRHAADLVGATKMDRPEDFEVNPVNKKVYLALTNNSSRAATPTQPNVDQANPRRQNRFGQVIEITEAGNDAAALTFTWDMLLLAGPQTDPTRRFDGAANDELPDIACPDNLTFDAFGNLWICTDGQPGSIQQNDSLFAVPVTGPDRGKPKRFFTGPLGCEVASAYITSDGTSMFASIQHPGEAGSLAAPQSRWPFHKQGFPRPSVVWVNKAEGDPRFGS